MASVTYEITGTDGSWRVVQDGRPGGLDYLTKEAAFEAAVGAAMLTIRDGLGVVVRVDGRAAGETALGTP